MSDAPDPPAPDVAELLRSVDADKAVELAKAFDAKAGENGADIGTVMWALAQLQARVLARAPMGTMQVWTAARFAQMVEVAFPYMALSAEKARRQAEGLPETDG